LFNVFKLTNNKTKMKKSPKLDNFEMMLFRLGYEPTAEIELNEETDFRNHHRVFPNIKPLKNIIRDFGFQEDTIIRVRYFDNKYYGTIYTKKE